MNFEHLTYYELINDFNKDFLIDYGRIKYDKVYNKVHSSEKISKLILLSKESRLTPLAKDFLYTINSIPFFIFSKSDTIADWGTAIVNRFPSILDFLTATGEDVGTAGNFTLVPLFIGIIMTFDNIFGVIFQPTFGKLSDHCHSRFGKRRPFVFFHCFYY